MPPGSTRSRTDAERNLERRLHAALLERGGTAAVLLRGTRFQLHVVHEWVYATVDREGSFHPFVPGRAYRVVGPLRLPLLGDLHRVLLGEVPAYH